MNKEHQHNFIETETKDDTMLCGFSGTGKCECGVSRFHTRVEIRWLLQGLIDLEKWKQKKKAEDLTTEEVVYLVKKYKAIDKYKEFSEEYAKLFLDNLDKFL
jgi:hypothetical protein